MANEAQPSLQLDYVPVGKTGRIALTVRCNGTVVQSLKVDIIDQGKRQEAHATIAQSLGSMADPANAAALNSELLRIAAEVAAGLAARSQGQNQPPNPAASAPDPDELLAAMPQAVREESAAMLRSPELVRMIVDDIAAIGVAGECELAVTVFLIGLSRMLTRPLSGIIQGPTSSGKSYASSKVADLCPAEGVIRATKMTPQALFHLPPGSLSHKWIVAGERSRLENDETAEATRALREMLSEGRLSKIMPVKVEGRIETKLIEQEGPIAYTESTTLSKVFDEDANRSLMLQTDERTEQTRLVVLATAKRYAGQTGISEADRARIVQKHHAIQRLIEPLAVVIPYAVQLADLFPYERCEARRAITHCLSMVEVLALLHQFQRERDDDGRLIATREDYTFARYLLKGPMEQVLGRRISKAAVRFYDRVAGRFTNDFDTREAQTNEVASEGSVRGWIRELHAAGCLAVAEPPHGPKPARWRFTAVTPDGGEPLSLPAPEKLFPYAALPACRQEITIVPTES